MTLWDLKAGFYDRGRQIPPFRRITEKELQNINKLLAPYTLARAAILDIATGTGIMLPLLRLYPIQSR